MTLRRDLHSERFPAGGWKAELGANTRVTLGADGIIRPAAGDILGPYLDPEGKEVSILEAGKSRAPDFRQDLQPGVLCTGAAEIGVLAYQLHEWCDITDRQLAITTSDFDEVGAQAISVVKTLSEINRQANLVTAKVLTLETLTAALFAPQ